MEQIKTQIGKVVETLNKGGKDLVPMLTVVSAMVRKFIDMNFQQRGRWDGTNTDLFSGGSNRWAPLRPFTIMKYKEKGYELVPTLRRTNTLKASIEIKPVGSNAIVISANTSYAQELQEGRSNMKPRPYLSLTETDLQKILDYVSKFAVGS